jgi:hypothetical protein
MLRKIHGTNFLHIKFLDRPNIQCQNGPVLPPAQVFYFNGQALHFTTEPKVRLQLCKLVFGIGMVGVYEWHRY